MIPHFKGHHHSLYVMNRYTGVLDIFDTRRYSGLDITRTSHHENRVEIVCSVLLSLFIFLLK